MLSTRVTGVVGEKQGCLALAWGWKWPSVTDLCLQPLVFGFYCSASLSGHMAQWKCFMDAMRSGCEAPMSALACREVPTTSFLCPYGGARIPHPP